VEEERLKAILESLLFAATEPVALSQLVAVIESVARDDIRRALSEMAAAYSSGGRGILLDEVANGYQLRTPKEHALYVRKLLAAKPPRLSRPLLEAVAIVAYRQPITRPEIEQLRGVDCGGVIESLVERRLIQIAGRKEAPGRPIMYTTTREFLELFGLKDLSALPDLEELRMIETPRDEPLFANLKVASPLDQSAGSESVEDPYRSDDSGTATSGALQVTDFVEVIEVALDGESAGEQIAALSDSGETESARPLNSDELMEVHEPVADAPVDEAAGHKLTSPSTDIEDHD
jgi:segregation and condensation protein B